MIDGYEKHTCTECETMFTSNEELHQHHAIDHGLVIENSIEWTDVQPEDKIEETDNGFTSDGKKITFSDEDKSIAESYLTETAKLQRVMVASEQRLKLARDEIKASEAETNAFYEQFLGESNGQDFSSGAGTINPLDTPKFKYSKNNKLADTINTKGYVPNPNAGLYDNKQFKEGGDHLEDPLAKEDFEVSFYGKESRASEGSKASIYDTKEDHNEDSAWNLHSWDIDTGNGMRCGVCGIFEMYNGYNRKPTGESKASEVFSPSDEEVLEYIRNNPSQNGTEIVTGMGWDGVEETDVGIMRLKRAGKIWVSGGGYVTEAKASESVTIDDFKRIKDNFQAEKLNFEQGSALVDVQTANAIVAVWDNINEEQRLKFPLHLTSADNVARLAGIAFKSNESKASEREEWETGSDWNRDTKGNPIGTKYDEQGNVISNEFGDYEVKCDACDGKGYELEWSGSEQEYFEDPCDACGGKGTNTWTSKVGKSDESLKADWDDSDYEEKYSWLKDLGVEDAFKYANMTLYELPEPVWQIVNKDYVQGFKQMTGESYQPDQKDVVETSEEKIISRKLDNVPVGQIARELVLWDNMSAEEAEKMVSETEPNDNDITSQSLFNKKYSELNENELAEMELYDV